jgi:uncharacterized protein RhaS with RHS repeats
LRWRTTTRDLRTGTSTTHYVSTTGRVDYVADETDYKTWYVYESATGRLAWVKNALNKYTRYAYNACGQATRIWGDVPQPTETDYDDHGQRTTLRTYHGGTEWTGAGCPRERGSGLLIARHAWLDVICFSLGNRQA